LFGDTFVEHQIIGHTSEKGKYLITKFRRLIKVYRSQTRLAVLKS